MDSKTETVSDNAAIAKFMGLEKYSDTYLYRSPLTNKYTDCRNFKYDTSWDWLMPVVIKCKSLAKGKTLDILPSIYNEILNALTDCNINLVHRHVVEFIKQFNSQSPATIK